MQAQPGARNTVPGRLAFPVDLRHPDRAVLDAMVAELRALVQAEGVRHRIDTTVEQVWHMPATRFDAQLVDLVESTAGGLGYTHRRLVSGAGHDSLHTARFAPTAMIFVPCKGGLSHNEAEDASPADLAAGANVLLHSILRTAQT
jgi:N-carbamoyl-L-amino-acid hydrolase